MKFLKLRLSKTHLRGLCLFIVLLFFWSFLSWITSQKIPPLSQIWSALIILLNSGELGSHIIVSLSRILSGFLLACITAIPLALFSSRVKNLTKTLSPLLKFSTHIPALTLVPLFIIWRGANETGEVFIIFLAAFLPLFIACEDGFRNADIKLIEVGKTMGLSDSKLFNKIILPSAVPSIIKGMQKAMTYSWQTLIGIELLVASSGLGFIIIDAGRSSRPDVIIAGILSIGLLGSIVDCAFRSLYKDWLPWTKGVFLND